MNKVYQIVADQIDAALAQGVVPWRKPWTYWQDDIQPANMTAPKKPYRGLNPLLLSLSPYSGETPWWLTFNQARKLGGCVRKGERSTIVTFWKQYPPKNATMVDPDTGETLTSDTKDRYVLRYFRLFNLAQIDGIAPDKVPSFEVDAPDAVEARAGADQTIAGYLAADGPSLTMSAGDRCCYKPQLDTVEMVPADRFESTEGYYSTVFHELGHSTGHKSRLARKSLVEGGGFSSKRYAEEELTAEFTAAFLSQTTGIGPAEIPNTAAYIADWRKRLADDPKILVYAAGRAQKAADWIRGNRQN